MQNQSKRNLLSTLKWKPLYTSLALFVCFPISDHLMLPLRIISFNLKQIHMEMSE